jgi:hypothetical protein
VPKIAIAQRWFEQAGDSQQDRLERSKSEKRYIRSIARWFAVLDRRAVRTKLRASVRSGCLMFEDSLAPSPRLARPDETFLQAL